MSEINANAEQLLYVVSGHIEEIVPNYERAQADVAVAIETGTGNCMGKAVIASAIFEHLTRPNLTAVFYNKGVHPSAYADMIGRSHLGFGHAAMLAQTSSGIWTLGFNINDISSGDKYVVPANDNDDERIAFEKNKIVAVDAYREELEVGDWYDVYRAYLEAVGIMNSSAHTMTREELLKLIINRVVNPPKHTDPARRSLSAA